MQSELCSTGKHSVWFICAQRRKVVNEDADVTLGSIDYQWIELLDFGRSIHSGNQTLKKLTSLRLVFY